MFAGVVVAIVIDRHSATRWAWLQQSQREAVDRIEARWRERRSLFADPPPGNSFETCWAAYRRLGSLDSAQKALLAEARRGEATTERLEAARALLRSSEKELVSIREGACRAEFRPSYDLTHPFPEDTPEIAGAHKAELLLNFSAAERRRAGDWSGALGELRVSLQCSLDEMRTPTMIWTLIGMAGMAGALDQLKELITAPEVPTDVVRSAVDLLRRAEGQWPPFADCLETERVYGILALVRHGEDMDLRGLALICCLFGSRRLWAADCAETYDRVIAAFRECEGKEWTVAEQRYEGLAVMSKTRFMNPVPLVVPALSQAARGTRRMRVRLRLLLLAGRERLGLKVPAGDETIDPFTQDSFQRTETENSVIFRSAWGAGSHHADWKWAPEADEAADCGIEVQRPKSR